MACGKILHLLRPVVILIGHTQFKTQVQVFCQIRLPCQILLPSGFAHAHDDAIDPWCSIGEIIHILYAFKVLTILNKNVTRWLLSETVPFEGYRIAARFRFLLKLL